VTDPGTGAIGGVVMILTFPKKCKRGSEAASSNLCVQFYVKGLGQYMAINMSYKNAYLDLGVIRRNAIPY
jgi:hypothetical protein